MAKKTITQSIIDLPYEDLTKAITGDIDVLKTLVVQLTKTAKGRVTRLQKDASGIGKYSPALTRLERDIKEPKKATQKVTLNYKEVYNMSRNDLMHQYARIKKFLTAKTSKLKGWEEVRKNIQKRTGAKKLFGSEYKSKKQATYWHNREIKFWELYNKLVENYGGIISQLDSDRIQTMLYQVMQQRNYAKSNDDISLVMNNYINSLYKSTYFNQEFDDNAYLEALKDESQMEEIRMNYFDYE